MPRQRLAYEFLFEQGQPYASANAARAACARYLTAIAAHFGYPRVPTESDVVRVGGGRHVPLSDLRWKWWCRPRLLPTGAAVVLDVAHPAIAALDGVTLPVPTTYDGWTVPGGGGTVTIRLDRGVPVSESVIAADETDP